METSITIAAINRFLKSASEQETLFCSRITGFYLVKTKTSASYRFKYTALDGKRRAKTIGSITEFKPAQAAEIALGWRKEKSDPHREEKARKDLLISEDRASDGRKLGDYIKGPYSLYQGRKKTGRDTINLLVSSFSDWMERDMSGLAKKDVMDWQQKKEKAGLAHSTIKRAYGAMKTLLRHAESNHVLDKNPLQAISLLAPSDSEVERQIHSSRSDARRQLTNEEISQLIHGLDAFSERKRQQRERSRRHGRMELPDLSQVVYPHWFHPFALLSLHTGLRPGDLSSLTWQELNLTFKRLVKIPEKTRHHPDPAKIIMDLTDSAIADIKPWWEQKGRPETGLVFPSEKTGRKISKGGYRTAWRKVRELAKLDEGLDFYALRHDFISRLIAGGVPMLTVARLAGHKSAKMIEQHYGHLCPSSARNALDVLDKSRLNQEIKPSGTVTRT